MICAHENFEVRADVCRLTKTDDGPLTGLSMEVTGRCVDCGEPLVFRCPDFGMVADRPAMSPNGQEIRIPFRVATDPEDFGLQLPGFTVRGNVSPSAN